MANAEVPADCTVLPTSPSTEPMAGDEIVFYFNATYKSFHANHKMEEPSFKTL